MPFWNLSGSLASGGVSSRGLTLKYYGTYNGWIVTGHYPSVPNIPDLVETANSTISVLVVYITDGIWHQVHRIPSERNEVCVEQVAVELFGLKRRPLHFLVHHNDIYLMKLVSSFYHPFHVHFNTLATFTSPSFQRSQPPLFPLLTPTLSSLKVL